MVVTHLSHWNGMSWTFDMSVVHMYTWGGLQVHVLENWYKNIKAKDIFFNKLYNIITFCLSLNLKLILKDSHHDCFPKSLFPLKNQWSHYRYTDYNTDDCFYEKCILNFKHPIQESASWSPLILQRLSTLLCIDLLFLF